METQKHMEDPSTSSSSIEPKTPVSKLLGSSYRRPSSSRTIYSDRFIPSRSSSDFALFNLPNSSANASSDDSRSAYTNLLKSALFGPECVGGANGFQPLTPEKSVSGGRFGSRDGDGSLLVSPPNCNIFKFKTETRKSLHSLSPFGLDDELPGVSHSPVKAPRKIPRSPYKSRASGSAARDHGTAEMQSHFTENVEKLVDAYQEDEHHTSKTDLKTTPTSEKSATATKQNTCAGRVPHKKPKVEVSLDLEVDVGRTLMHVNEVCRDILDKKEVIAAVPPVDMKVDMLMKQAEQIEELTFNQQVRLVEHLLMKEEQFKIWQVLDVDRRRKYAIGFVAGEFG